jgi:hypothetical protein
LNDVIAGLLKLQHEGFDRRPLDAE